MGRLEELPPLAGRVLYLLESFYILSQTRYTSFNGYETIKINDIYSYFKMSNYPMLAEDFLNIILCLDAHYLKLVTEKQSKSGAK